MKLRHTSIGLLLAALCACGCNQRITVEFTEIDPPVAVRRPVEAAPQQLPPMRQYSPLRRFN